MKMKRTDFFKRTSRAVFLFAACTFFSRAVFAQEAAADDSADSAAKAEVRIAADDSVAKAEGTQKAAVPESVHGLEESQKTAVSEAADKPNETAANESALPISSPEPPAAVLVPEEKAEPAQTEEPVPPPKAILQPQWIKDGAVISTSPTKVAVILYAEAQNIADGTEATIRIMEKDGDGNDDEIETVTVQAADGKIEYAWTVIYTADDDDSNSEEENTKKGFSLPEYAFTVECAGLKSEESGQLNVTGEGLVFSGVKNNTKDYVALKLENRDADSGLDTVIIAPNENLPGKFDGAVLKDGTIIKVSAKAPARVNFTINEDADGNISYVITDSISVAVDTGANIIKNLENSLLNGDKLLSGIYYNQHEEDAVLHSWWKTVAEEAGSPESWQEWYNSDVQKSLRQRAVG